MHRRRVLEKSITYVGLDVHKDTIAVALAEAGAHEIADRLMSLIGNPNGSQFTGPMQLGEVDRIPPVGLDPISWFAWDQRRSHDDAAMPGKVNCRWMP